MSGLRYGFGCPQSGRSFWGKYRPGGKYRLRRLECRPGYGSMTGLGMAAFPSMPLPSGSACATGISLGLKEKGQEDTKVVLIGGDGSLGDIGFTALSGAAERNSDFLCVTEDNEAYANTGIQRSGATPQYAWTTTTPVGNEEKGKKHTPQGHAVDYWPPTACRMSPPLPSLYG